MGVLIVSHSRFASSSILDGMMAMSLADTVYEADNLEKAIQILESRSVHTVLLMVSTLRDFALVKYINKFHRKLQLVLMANDELLDVIETIRSGDFNTATIPYRLEELAAINKSQSTKSLAG